MEALKEITGGDFHPHIYLLDGTTLIAYLRVGDDEPTYFSKGIRGFDKRGRKFEKVSLSLFKSKPKQAMIEVKGSKGNTYYVNKEESTCTCPGYTYRGSCKHITELLK